MPVKTRHIHWGETEGIMNGSGWTYYDVSECKMDGSFTFHSLGDN